MAFFIIVYGLLFILDINDFCQYQALLRFEELVLEASIVAEGDDWVFADHINTS